MKKKFSGIILILLFLFALCISVNAQDSIKVYNRGKEVILTHELFSYNEQYYLHIDDLQQLGLDVINEDGKYTITANDCLGEEKKVVLTPPSSNLEDNPPILIDPFNQSEEQWAIAEIQSLEDLPIIEAPSVMDTLYQYTYKRRATKKIGESINDNILFPEDDSVTGGGNSLLGTRGIIIDVKGETYISAQFIGKYLSHRYSLEGDRIDYYIADKSAVVMNTTVNLIYQTGVPSGGHEVKIHTAYKIGEDSSMDGFKLLSSVNCIIAEGENSASLLIETPAEKINDPKIYYIADFGDRYVFVCNQYNFSEVGKVIVYGQPKDITYTINVTLPEIDDRDVPFTIYVSVNNETYSKQGIVKSGEKSTSVELTKLPIDTRYDVRIVFDYHKYRNAQLGGFNFINIAYVKDFGTNYTAKYSRKAVCNVCLPDGYIPEDDVEVTVVLRQYIPNGGLVVTDKFYDWSDSQTVILNNEKRFEQICLYSQSSSSMLAYQVDEEVEGLWKSGFLHQGGKITSSGILPKEIEEDLVTDIKLLKKKNITVKVTRPYFLSVENDIYATIVLDDSSTAEIYDKIIDYTQTPLIVSGERTAQFEFEVAEDKIYKLWIEDITGDEHLFNSCSYVKPLASVAERGNERYFGFECDGINLNLLRCNNVSGTIECENTELDFDVLATCTLYNDKTIYLTTNAENGEFNIKIPQDTDKYTIDVQTYVNKKSYYVSDGISTNNANEASEILFEYDEDKKIVLQYIMQNPPLPVEISNKEKYDYFRFRNISDYTLEGVDAYVAYYDKNGRFISIEKEEVSKLPLGFSLTIPKGADDYRIKKARALALKQNTFTPLGKVVEVSVNMPEPPEQNISVFKIGEESAIINCKTERLNSVPEEINEAMYISADDFERLGYKITVDETDVYIEKGKLGFKFIIGENTAIQAEDAIRYEISNPILNDGGIIIPIDTVCELFDDKSRWNPADKILIINMPFDDIEYSDIYCEAILDMYNKGIVAGYEDGTFKSSEYVFRSEAAAMFSRTMGYEYQGYIFDCFDVMGNHWAKSYIGICVNEGVFELEDDRFRPNDYITVKEAIVATLKMKGVVFDNYIDAAQANGLLTNIKVENEEREITRAEITQLLYNACI